MNDKAAQALDKSDALSKEYELFYRLGRLESDAIQLAIDLGELRADQARRVQDMGGKL